MSIKITSTNYQNVVNYRIRKDVLPFTAEFFFFRRCHEYWLANMRCVSVVVVVVVGEKREEGWIQLPHFQQKCKIMFQSCLLVKFPWRKKSRKVLSQLLFPPYSLTNSILKFWKKKGLCFVILINYAFKFKDFLLSNLPAYNYEWTSSK